jgi:hypothetical protein
MRNGTGLAPVVSTQLSTEGASFDSPGRIPGLGAKSFDPALKGRDRGDALSGLDQRIGPDTQGCALGYRISSRCDCTCLGDTASCVETIELVSVVQRLWPYSIYFGVVATLAESVGER